VRGRLRVLRLATADTGSLRPVVPNTCPSLSRPFRLADSYYPLAIAEKVPRITEEDTGPVVVSRGLKRQATPLPVSEKS